jgi:hypothetical protein
MLLRNRLLTVCTAASYLLVVTASALFHEHHDHHDEQPRPGVSASQASDDHDCSVCQFLAQKPAPTSDITPEGISTLVQSVSSSGLPCVACDTFTAWQSRAPPVSA